MTNNKYACVSINHISGAVKMIPIPLAKDFIDGKVVMVGVNTLLKCRKVCLLKMAGQKIDSYFSDDEAAELHNAISEILPPEVQAQKSNSLLQEKKD